MNEHNFTLLPITLPPMLPKMVGVVGNNRYFSIAYWGSKATWSDGRGLGTFSYFGVYSPLIEHPVLAIHLESYNLGSDDLPPTNAILCDRLEQKMYVGDYAEVEKLLETQHPPVPNLSPEELSQLPEQIALNVADFDLEQFQRLGMFELFAGHSEQQKLELVELVQWLDQLVTEDLLQQYVEAAKKGNWTAISVLQKLSQRLQKS
jgi:hypothetical protein